jgi:hypothetical protein
MSRALLLIVMVTVSLGITKPASADLTAFIGSTTRSPSHQTVRGAAIGLSLAVVGFEFEYSDTSENAQHSTPALQSSIFNVLVQTPFEISRLQFYGTIGGGIYRERISDSVDIGFGSNIGAGLKVSLIGPLRARIDYRVFRLGRDSVVCLSMNCPPANNSTQRVYVGFNVGF